MAAYLYAVEKRQRMRIVMIAVPAFLGGLLWLWTTKASLKPRPKLLVGIKSQSCTNKQLSR